MPAYVIANVDVHDSEAYREYQRGTPASIADFDGRFLARGGAVDIKEGDWRPKRLVLVEFANLRRATEWYESDTYQALRRVREAAATTDLLFVDGTP